MGGLYESSGPRHQWSPALRAFAETHLGGDGVATLEELAATTRVGPDPRPAAALTADDRTEGWILLPSGAAVSSPTINRTLTGKQLAGETIPMQRAMRWKLSTRIRQVRARAAIAALAHQFKDRPLEHNDPKLRLAADLGPLLRSGEPVPIELTDFLSSRATNGLAATSVTDLEGRPLLAGRDLISDSFGRLAKLSASTASNHMGGTVLAITLDGQLLLPARATTKGSGVGTLDPSGVGTLNVFDFDHSGGNLLAYVINGLGREVAAECGVPRGARIDVLLTGHSRNLAVGGAPDFHAIAVIGCTVAELDTANAENTGILTLTVAKDPTALAEQFTKLSKMSELSDRPLSSSLTTTATMAAFTLTHDEGAREWLGNRMAHSAGLIY